MQIINVADVLGAVEIPAGLESHELDTPDTQEFDDPEDWKDEWRDEDWFDGLPVPSWLFEDVLLDDLNTVMMQNVGGSTGFALLGNFSFADLRDVMEDEDWDEDSYRDFEVWDDRNVALLEESGVILLGDEYVEAVLKGLDTERGLIDGESAMRKVLDKAGTGLQVWAATEECTSVGLRELSGCQAYAMAIAGGDVETTVLSGAYLFKSESRAESRVDDIEDGVYDSDDIDADIERISADGEFVTYEITVHE